MARTKPLSQEVRDYCLAFFVYRHPHLYRLTPVGVRPSGRYNAQILVPTKEGPQRLLKHRIIHLLNTGDWPDIVDHADGDPHNNHPDNLRSANQLLNARNRKRRRNSKDQDLPVGVSRAGEAYHVATKTGKKYRCHYFTDLGEAIAFRTAWEKKHLGAFAPSARPIIPALR